jgi:hypothetical protein
MSYTRSINGLKVVNAKEPIILNITVADIKKANGKDPSTCAAAIACRRSLGAKEALVHLGRTYLRFNGKWERYVTSPELRHEIIGFDHGKQFDPGEYTLYGIQPSKRRGKRQGSDKKRQSGKPRKKYTIAVNVRPTGVYA